MQNKEKQDYPTGKYKAIRLGNLHLDQKIEIARYMLIKKYDR